MRGHAFLVAIGAMTLGFSLVSPADAKIDVGAASPTSPPDVMAFGDAQFVGSTNPVTFNEAIVGIAGTRSSHGYWEAATDGGVFGFGDAQFFGSMGGTRL